MKDKKAIYSFVTTFLFIVILIFAVLAITFVARFLEEQQKSWNDQAAKFDNLPQIKQRLFRCYGQVFSEVALNDTCEITEGIISGYQIVLEPYRNCSTTHQYYPHGNIDFPEDKIIYHIPIQMNETGLICPGKLEVFI